MARSSYSGLASVEPSTQAPDDLQHIEASPNAFGAPLAQGAEALGQGATAAAKFYGTVAADNGTNDTLQQVTAILHGDPNKMVMGPDGKPAPDTGYLGMRGADAMSHRAEVGQQIDEIIKANRESLSTPEAKLQYDVDTRRNRAQWLTQIGSHADTQQHVWATDTNNTAYTLALNSAAQSPMDAMGVVGAHDRARNAAVKNAQLNGEDPQGAVLKADQDVALARIRSLVVSNPTDARRVLNENSSVLGSLPNYDALNRQVKEAVNNQIMAPAVHTAVQDVLAHARTMTGPPGAVAGGGTADMHTAILGQESNNNSGVHPSIQGAIGPGQIMPDTFAQFAHPGEHIDNPADNRAVSARIIDHYNDIYHGDAGRVATAYFSGPGNVAPAGSATPYKHDYADGNGKHTSAYVSDVMDRMGGGQAAQGGQAADRYPSTADAINANMSTYLDQARQTAEKLFPQDADVQERYVSLVERGLDRTISQQTRQYSVDSHVVQAALASDHAPISEQELLASSPRVATAWRAMQVENPTGAESIRHMFDANAKGKASGYGTNFKDYLDRALAPAKDPNRVSAASQLWPFVGAGEDAPLTNTGASALSDLIGQRGTPAGEAFATQLKGVVDQFHAEMTFSNASLGRRDVDGEALYNKFMVQALPILQKANQNGTLASVLNPKSPDYIGHIAQTYMRTPAQMMKDQLYTGDINAEQAKVNGEAESGRFLLTQAVLAGRLTKAQATTLGEERGWFKRAAPPPGTGANLHLFDAPR